MPTARARAERQAAVADARRASRRGRPTGSVVHLLVDEHRFETAAWLTATEGFGLGPAQAGGLVSVLFAEAPIEASMAGDMLLRLSSGVENATLKGRADRIRRRADRSIRRRDDAGEAWLLHSCAALVLLITADADLARMAAALATLRSLGWGPVLAQMAARLEVALSSNFPPSAEPMSNRARRLADALSVKGHCGQEVRGFIIRG